jgi:folate-dependent phosphoribosylglycinamide formyltransferase PurN
MVELNKKIAYITINPGGKFVKSAQLGFEAVGLRPECLIHVSPKGRLLKEFKKYKFGIISLFIIPKLMQHFGNKKSFSNEVVDIPIPVKYKVNKLNSENTAELIKNLQIKYLINCGAGIFRKPLIQIPGLLIVNAHAGKLPEYRNMNVVEWALYMGDKVMGTIHTINEGIDTGDILHQEELNLRNVLNYEDAREKAFDQVIRLAGKVVLGHYQGKIHPVSQKNMTGKNWYKMHSYFQKKLTEKLSQFYRN